MPSSTQECVLCGDGILSSIETEQYARPGAVKRTLVHFIAKEEAVNIACNIRVLNCFGCAERSCEKRPALLMYPAVTHSLVYPVIVATKGWTFPLWLLILLIILFLLALLACCLIPFLLFRTETAILKDTAVGCKNVHRPSLETDTFHRITPAVAIEDREPITSTTEMYAREERRVVVSPMEEPDRGGYYGTRERRRLSEAESGYYGTRERARSSEAEGFYGTRERARSIEAESGFYGSRERARMAEDEAAKAAHLRDTAVTSDRSSYRNYAYQRDHGGVAPVEGFDQVETRERRYCISDDEDYELVEKDVKRTHTSRFMQETRQINEDDKGSTGERYREEDVHHAVYSQSLPV
ncbi:unnamed protein product [Strongylus vulgaris]|uniref:Uncharacterized protein n=1 Tax=Strongylus vulgaris TaxID=40348 RepID=A0A3P7LBK0_STRVU|nr:unnamed protein product [Strongylus vulgaris]